MAKKILNLDIENGVQSWEDGSALPEGTENQTLRHNGTEWVANNTVKSEVSFNSANIQVKNPSASYPYAVLQYVSTGTTYGMLQVAHDSSTTATLMSNRNVTDGKKETQLTLSAQQSYILMTSTNPRVDAYAIEINNGSAVYFRLYQDGKIVSNYLSGTTSALLKALPDGTIQRSAIALNTQLEYITPNTLSGTEHIFNNATLGITGDLRSRIKFIDVYAVDADGNWNSDLIDAKFVYATDITINSTIDLSGTWKIKLYIEYV